MNRSLRSHGTAGSLGAKPRNAPTRQRADACLEALERDEGGDRLGEEEVEEARRVPGQNSLKKTESLQERKMAKKLPL